MDLTETEREYCTETARRMGPLAMPLSFVAASLRERGDEDAAAEIEALAIDLHDVAYRIFATIRED